MLHEFMPAELTPVQVVSFGHPGVNEVKDNNEMK